jgi:hypothetical protein
METNNGQKHISPFTDLLLLKEKQDKADGDIEYENNGNKKATWARPKSNISLPPPHFPKRWSILFSTDMLYFDFIKIDSSSFDLLGENQVNICFRHKIFKTRGVN